MMELKARLVAGREFWCEPAPGKRLKLRRPREAEMAVLRHGVGVDDVCRAVVDWDGFTEAVLLGATVGSSDAVPFDKDLADEVLRDHLEWAQPAADALAQAVTEHLASRAAAAKN